MIDIPLTTERLVIRRFGPEDLGPYLAFMLDDDSTKHLAFEAEQKTEAGARGLFDYVCGAYDTDHPVHAYAVADRRTGQYVGSCGFADYDEGVVEVYYSINAPYRDQGFAAEATRAIAAELARSVEVRAYCHPDNHAAHGVATSAGFASAGLAEHRGFDAAGQLFIYQPEG